MPHKPLKACSHSGCPNLTAGSKCEEHQKQDERRYNQRRGSAASRGYDNQWSKIRVRKLNRDPLCERCMKLGSVVGAYLVHHIDRNPKINKWENLESLCKLCHDEEHKEERWK